MNNMDDQAALNETEPARTLPYHLVRRLVTLALVFGIVGGLAGSFLVVNFLPGLVPVDKKQVLLQENSAAIDVAKKVSPSVVSITSQTTGFNFFGGAQTEQGAGTGIIVSSDGLILTNNHVVPSDASNFSAYTSDGKQYSAQVVARDTQNDIAFVRINASGLTAASLGNSAQVTVGQKVVAIGNALGQYQNTVTEGIISGKGRPVVASDQNGSGAEQLQDLFQTDAAINPGNSGGPLVDLSGNVIGINTAVAGEGQNIGFAIPINEVKPDFDSVKSQGKIVRPYLGVHYIPVTREFASANHLPVDQGAYVSGDNNTPGVIQGGPADNAGIKDGDIITKVAGQVIDANHSLSSLVAQHHIGDKVSVTFLRGSKEQSVDVTLQQAPSQ